MNNIPDTILYTKIRKPGINPYYVKRSRIYEELNQALMTKLTVVASSAGYGKTSSVLDWIATTDFQSAWLSLDASDNEPLLFWQYIFAAFNESIQSFSLPRSILQNKEYFDSKIFITALLNRLSEIKDTIVLIIDDFHLIYQSEIHEDLAYFINYLPDNVHILVLTRNLSSTIFQKIKSFEKMLVISGATLRFTKEEIYQFYKSRGHILEKEELLKIQDCTEGWALALVAEYANNTIYRESYRLISSYKGYDVLLEGYIHDEFVSSWTSEQQNFMLKTSILDRFCDGLCDAVMESDSREVLIYLYQHNSFISHVEGEELWFRYHNRYIDFLRKELIVRYPEEIAKLHIKAGDWYEEAGYLSEAMSHYRKSGDNSAIVRLIHKHSDNMMKRGDSLILCSWVESLPEEITLYDYDMLVIKAVKCIGNRDFVECEAYLKHMEELLAQPADVNEERMNRSKYLLIKSYLVLQYEITDNYSEISGLLAELADIILDDISLKLTSELNPYDISAYRDIIGGTPRILHRSPKIYEQLVTNYFIATNSDASYDYLVRGEYYYETNRLNDSLEMICEAERNGEYPGVIVPIAAVKVKIKRAWGIQEDAAEILDLYMDRIRDNCMPHWFYMLQAVRAQLLLNLGKVEEAFKWVEASKLSVHQEVTRIREFELLVYARILIRMRNFDKAIILLNNLLAYAKNNNRLHSQVEILNLLAIASSKAMNEERACIYMERALSIGLQEGYIRSFLDEYGDLRIVLNMYLNQHKGNSKLTVYAKRITKLLMMEESELQEDTEQEFNLSVLTPAESRILQYVVEGWSNENIAEELSITVRTVKAHTGSIYKKVNVKSRVECIIKARKAFRQ